MAKKNGQTGGEDSPVETKANSPEDRHAKLRDDRRKLEAELAAINGKLREAINNGDLESLETLTARKAELPKLFIQASIAETTVRQEIFNAEDQVNLKALRTAEDERDGLQLRIAARQREFESEMAELKTQLQDAEQSVGAALATITASRNLGAINDAGFKRSLAALTGV